MEQFEYVDSAARLPHIAQEISQAPRIAFDLETTGFSPFNCDVRLCSINTGKGVYVIDAFKTGTLGPVLEAMHNPNQLTGAGHPLVIFQNGKFDQKFFLKKYQTELWPVFDTFRSSAMLHNGIRMGHNLYDLYHRELGIGPEAPDLGGSDWSANELSDDQKAYAAEDVIHLPKLYEKLRPQLQAQGLLTIAAIEFGAILPEAAVELNGFFLNSEAWTKLAEENETSRDELQEYLWRVLDDPSDQISLPGMPKSFNLDSPEQLLKSLRMLGMKIENTAEITLAMQLDRFPVVSKILDYRQASTAVKSFGGEYLKHINPITKRIHPDYYGFLAAGRYSCSHPNLAQIPRNKAFRKCFQAQEGNVLVLADYSNIEMRIVAEISDDRTLIDTFRAGKDAHRFTASILKGKPEPEVSKEERQQAKPVNFGFIYGMMPPKLVLYAQSNYGVKLSLGQAEDFRERYFERFHGVGSWHQKAWEGKNRKPHMVRSIGGRLRFLDDEAHNEYLNTPVQATGADGLKASLRDTYFATKKWGADVRMVHHVHDEIILEVKDDPQLIEETKHALSASMQKGMSQFLKKVPVDVEAVSGKTWADKA